MKTILRLTVLIVLLGVAAKPCFALMVIDNVSKSRAKELGIEVRSKPSGPTAVRVELEFKTDGPIKIYDRVMLDITQGGKLLLSSSLHEERSSPGHIVVIFTAARASLDDMTLRVMTGSPTDATAHDLRLKDFVDLEKLK